MRSCEIKGKKKEKKKNPKEKIKMILAEERLQLNVRKTENRKCQRRNCNNKGKRCEKMKKENKEITTSAFTENFKKEK